jgi:hypothetical protein
LELGRGLQAELFFDVRAVDVHGFGAEVEAGGDFLGAPAFAKLPHDLKLAVGQFGLGTGIGFARQADVGALN